MKGYEFFKRLDNRGVNNRSVLSVRDERSSTYYKQSSFTFSIIESLAYGVRELLLRLAFTAVGCILIWWSWNLLISEIPRFPELDWFTVIIAVITLLVGIRNALSIFKGLSWGQVFLTLVFVAANVYLVWFA